MDINGAFPSDYLRALDLQGRDVNVVIDAVRMEQLGGEPKPIVFFRNKQKGMVLNKTNANNIAAVYGPETDGWAGRPITLYPTQVDFQGRSVPAIRVRPLMAQQAAQNHQAPPPNNGQGQAAPPGQEANQAPPPAGRPGGPGGDFDDEIPF